MLFAGCIRIIPACRQAGAWYSRISVAMEFYPVINCHEFACVKHRIEACKTFLSRDGMIHLDIADARFTFGKTWGTPAVWKRLHIPFPAEVHLMVENPEAAVKDWLDAGAKRVIVHIEALMRTHAGMLKNFRPALEAILAACTAKKAELMLALSPETHAEEINPFIKTAKLFQVLAVEPGPSGQKIIPSSVEKIRALRKLIPKNAKIEVDGGITLETARAVKLAGADIVVSGSYLFKSPRPDIVYKKFLEL